MFEPLLVVLGQTPDLSPNAGGLPGSAALASIVQGLAYIALLGCGAGIIIGAGMWASAPPTTPSFKLSRASGTTNVMVMHRLSDLASAGAAGSHQVRLAEGLLADTETRVIYGQPANEVDHARELQGLSDTEAKLLLQLPRGQAREGRDALVPRRPPPLPGRARSGRHRRPHAVTRSARRGLIHGRPPRVAAPSTRLGGAAPLHISQSRMCILAVVRTNIDIDDELLARAQAVAGTKGKKATVEFALRELVRRKERHKALELRGKVSWEGDLDRSRAAR